MVSATVEVVSIVLFMLKIAAGSPQELHLRHLLFSSAFRLKDCVDFILNHSMLWRNWHYTQMIIDLTANVTMLLCKIKRKRQLDL
jgi:hypothetical protein